jgi:LCP family protein required for cell wall assembly
MSLGDVQRLGGPASTVRAVRRLTGLPINEYAEVRSTALARAVDTVGGVWVNVPSGAAASEASSTTQALMVGSQRLSGADALAFALATTTVDPVFARIRNQGLVVSALGSALSARTTSPLALLTKIAPCTKTSMGLGELSGTLSSAGSAGKFGVFSAVVTGQRQQRFVVPDSVALSRLVGDMRNERPFDVPSATLGQAAADAASAVSSKPPSQVTVTVRNGAGLSGAAKQAAGLLQTHGFVIAGTGNANMNVYPHTLVVYRSDPAVADLVAQYLQPGVRIVRSYGLYSFKSEILLMIGKDWDISRAPVVEIKAQ